jgi:multisubunit Na+/H+ antiporter MnhB subunit
MRIDITGGTGVDGHAPRARKQPRIRGFVLLPALILGVVGVVYAAWYLLPEFIEGGDPSTVPVFVIYLVFAFVAGAVPGIVVGLCTLAGIYLAHEVRPGLPSELAGISLAAGSATAVLLLLFFPYYGIDLLWLHIALTVLVPAALCRYAARYQPRPS